MRGITKCVLYRARQNPPEAVRRQCIHPANDTPLVREWKGASLQAWRYCSPSCRGKQEVFARIAQAFELQHLSQKTKTRKVRVMTTNLTKCSMAHWSKSEEQDSAVLSEVLERVRKGMRRGASRDTFYVHGVAAQ
jgi:hypothetical protein